MLLNAKFLQSDVVLEHLTEVDGDTLADGAVDRIVNVQLVQGEVRRVENGENADDTVMVNLVVAETERAKLIVREEQLSDHHCTACLDFVHVEVE